MRTIISATHIWYQAQCFCHTIKGLCVLLVQVSCLSLTSSCLPFLQFPDGHTMVICKACFLDSTQDYEGQSRPVRTVQSPIGAKWQADLSFHMDSLWGARVHVCVWSGQLWYWSPEAERPALHTNDATRPSSRSLACLDPNPWLGQGADSLRPLLLTVTPCRCKQWWNVQHHTKDNILLLFWKVDMLALPCVSFLTHTFTSVTLHVTVTNTFT